ncbi:MAG: dihydrofolate reductase [Burkholderiales bacterium]|nr:dihydrofolate reductase [Burkholderiales bacterium]
MRLSLIVAMAENRAIGVANRLPWHLPADLKHFRSLTMGHPIIMGRKTFDSIGRVLPGRRNIVVTRNPEYVKPGVTIAHSLDEAFDYCKAESEAFVIGGADVYRAAIERADRIYLTLVHSVTEGDVFFSAIDESQWQEIERVAYPADPHNAHAYDFIVYDRKHRQET